MLRFYFKAAAMCIRVGPALNESLAGASRHDEASGGKPATLFGRWSVVPENRQGTNEEYRKSERNSVGSSSNNSVIKCTTSKPASLIPTEPPTLGLSVALSVACLASHRSRSRRRRRIRKPTQRHT